MANSKKIIAATLISTILSTNAMALPQTSTTAVLPQNGKVVNGAAKIGVSGNIMNVDQSTSRADINWSSFNIGTNARVNFNSANSSDVTINKVTGNSPSLIQGILNSNHRVAVLNDSGITFTKGSKVNVGSLIASTAKDYKLEDQNKLTLSKFGNGAITNAGNINADSGGLVALIASRVENTGNITANNGQVALGSAKSADILLSGVYGDRINYQVNEEYVAKAGISNTGNITSHNGVITLTTKQAADARTGAINLGGVLDASSFGYDRFGGWVMVDSSSDLTSYGKINASGPISAGVIDTKAARTNYFTGEYKSQGSEARYAANQGEIAIKGKDVIFAGNIKGESFTPDTVSTRLVIESENGLIIQNGSRGNLEIKNVLFEKDLEKMSKSVDLDLHGSKLVVANLKDNTLDIGHNINFSNYKYDSVGGDFYSSGSVTGLDKNDVIKADGVFINATNNVNIGNINAKAVANISSGYGNVTTENITSGGSLSVSTYQGDLTTGNLTANGDKRYPSQNFISGYVNLDSNGGDIKVKNIEIQSSSPKDIDNSSSKLNVDARNYLSESKTAGDVKIGNIKVVADSTKNKTATADAEVNIYANKIELGNVDIKSLPGAYSDNKLSHGKLNVRADTSVNLGYVKIVDPASK